VAENTEAAARLLEQRECVESVATRNGRIVVTLRPGHDDYADLSTLLVQSGHKLTLFREEEVTLESAFMALTKGMGSQT
jgi:ABC-2 type transport system ATP-binding protein